jgi:hypothetical protein
MANVLVVMGHRSANLIHRHTIQVMIACHVQGSPRPDSGCLGIFPDETNRTPPGS